jgi:uncharacterized protein (DUF1015 family)
MAVTRSSFCRAAQELYSGRIRAAGAAGIRMITGCISPALRLTIKPDLVPASDPIGRLPITVLTRNVIEPLLGIKDPRTDKRIDFIGGARGLAELERRVKSGEMAVAFALYPGVPQE